MTLFQVTLPWKLPRSTTSIFGLSTTFAANSSISAAIFHKQITNPIEQAPTDGVAGTNNLTYSNNQSVDLTGFELDANITLFDGLDWDGFIAGNPGIHTATL